MNETYVESMVAQKTPAILVFVKVLLWLLTGVSALAGFAGFAFFIIAAMIFGVIAYFVTINTSIEYEYLYLDKEISIDKISGKSKRKRVATYEVDKIEIMAPFRSYQLDNYKNRQFKVCDYSSREEKQPDTRFVFFYNGTDKVIIEPSPELVKAVKNVAPRKVFLD